MISLRKIFPFLIAVTCMPGSFSFGQASSVKIKPDQYRAIHFSLDNGLVDLSTNVMIKDAMGFLWIGSGNKNVLSRFDGAETRKYFPDSVKKGAYNGGNIHRFAEDSLKNIWIGTSEGLSRYDIRADTFSNFAANIDSSNTDLSIVPLWCTDTRLYCREAGTSYTYYDTRTLIKTTLLKFPDTRKSGELHPRKGEMTHYVYMDTSAYSLWMLFYDEDHPDSCGLLSLSLKDGKRHEYKWKCFRNKPGHGHGSEDMRYDHKRNSLWINSSDGLLEFSLKSLEFKPVKAMKEYVELKDYERWLGIELDQYGRLWVATQPKGILIYDPETEQVQQLFADPEIQKTTGTFNFHLYGDRDGIVWASYWQAIGLDAMLPIFESVHRYRMSPGVKDSMSNDAVYTIIPAGKGKLWMGTGDGINIFDPGSGTFEVLQEKDLQGISGKAILPLHIDTIRQLAWLKAGSVKSPMGMGVYDMNFYAMDMQTGNCSFLTFRNGTIHFDKTIIVPTEIKPYKDGFLAVDDIHGVFEITARSLFAELIIPFDKQRSISNVCLAYEKLLFLEAYNGLPNFTYQNINGKWERIHHMMDSVKWRSMFYDRKDDTYWISFDFEIVHYDKNFKEIKVYSQGEANVNSTTAMLTDNSGILWMTNIQKQITSLDPASGLVSMLSEMDGYYEKDFDWSVPLVKDHKGNIYIGIGFEDWGSRKGLDVFRPEHYATANIAIVYLRNFLVNRRTIPLSTGINDLEELSLPYNENSISIEPGIIDFYARGTGRIRYKMTGRDTIWKYVPLNSPIWFDGLSPGNYTLSMQASNYANTFSGPVKTITFIINPPFWQTWWFRILAVVAVVAALYAIIQYRSRALKAENLQLEEKVKQRTEALNQSLEKLKATQNQLIHSEKMASLGELTAGIAHEIQNPLNFVNNFSDLNAELIAEMKEEIKKGNIDEVTAIADDIDENEKKISHHGKRADAIVKGMLQHSRAGTGQKELTDINALADEWLRLSYHGMRSKEKDFNATIQTDFDRSIEKINVIPQDIGRVLLNTINNALYAVNEKKKQQGDGFEPVVSLVTRQLNGYMEVRIKDNGYGIPQKIQDKIFQPFFTTKPTGEGTGLGLSMSYDIIKAHQGEIRINSTTGEGVEFIITLPADT